MNLTRYRPTLLAALALALAVTAGCFPQPPTPAPPCTPVDRPIDVYEFGDSLSAWAAHTPAGPEPGFTGICENFTDHTDIGLSLNAMGGTRVDHHWPTMANIIPGTCILVFLGTNDIGNLPLEDAKWNALAGLNLLRDGGARSIVWGLLDENSASHRSPEILAKVQGYNAFLHQTVDNQTYGDLLTLYDWNAMAAGHDEYLVDDFVHHTNAGADAYSGAVLGAYRQGCAP